jgi:hypothetical protein
MTEQQPGLWLFFGVELEILISPPEEILASLPKTDPNEVVRREHVAHRLSHALSENCVDNKVPVQDQAPAFLDWSVESDESITQNQKQNLWGLELISPILQCYAVRECGPDVGIANRR